jgi:hypothetical protein
MKNDVQLYGNPLTGESSLRIMQMNSGSKVFRTQVLLGQPYLLYIRVFNIETFTQLMIM